MPPENEPVSRYKINVKRSFFGGTQKGFLKFLGASIGALIIIKLLIFPTARELEYRKCERELALLTKDPKNEEDITYL